MKTKLTILSLIFLFLPAVSHGATEFISVIDPDNGSGTDYTSLSAWEAANQVDLTSAATLVIAGSLTRGTIADGVAITQTTTGATAVCVHHSSSQMLISTLVGTPDATSTWYPTANGNDTTNAWTPTTVGDSAIAIAKCRSTAGTADTTAVTIDGWTTSATNYIKVWTDPSENYRHNGKWDEGKYRLEVTTNRGIYPYENYLTIDGLQIKINISTAGSYAGIYTTNIAAGGSDIKISNNIIRGSISGTADYANGITLNDADITTTEIWNNIVYDFSGSISAVIYLNVMSGYIHNNTLYNSFTGIYRSSGTVIAKNNIAYNNTDNYSGTFDASSTNNLSGPGADADIPATNARNGYVVHFADEANDDFHLDSADTAARNQGIILYDSGDDANLNFTTDIDNNARLDSAGTWDIGADEAIIKVYRSVGPSATTALAVGGTYGNVEIKPAYLAGSTTTITDYVATFWSDLPTNVGVGDALQYDDDDDGDIDASDSIVFITKRIDASHFSVRTASGSAPASTLAPDSNWSIFRAYTSLFNAEAGTENTGIDADLVNFDTWTNGKNIQTSQEQWNIAAYANGTTADTVATTIDSWTTTADSFIKIYTPTRSDEVGVSQRHSGVWDDNKYKINSSTGDSILFYGTYLRIDGIQIDDAESNYLDAGISAAGTFAGQKVFISNNILKNSGSGAAGGISIEPSSGSFYIWNNIIYGFNNAIQFSNTATGYIYNNTMNDMTNYSGIRNQNNNSILYAKNNIVQGSPSSAYSGVFQAGSDYNISDDTTNTGGAHDKISQTVAFADSANFDFRLAVSDTSAKNAGTDLSNDPYIPFNTDIDSTCLRKDNQSRVSNGGDDLCYTRPRTTSWDIGADELITKIYRSVAPGEDEVLEAGASNHFNISGSTATFDTALGNDVGVGDALEYDDDNNGTIDASDSIAFITARISSTVFTIKTATGGVPTAPSAADEIHWNINRAYTSLTNAEVGTENTLIDSDLRNFDAGNRNIATNSEQWYFACYAHGTTGDSAAVTIDGWTTAPQNYIKIYTPTSMSEVGISQRHQGKWDEGKYKRDGISMNTSIEDDYVRMEGLQIRHTRSSGTGYGFLVQNVSNSSDVKLSNNIVIGVLSGTAVGYGVWINDADANIKFWNNIISGFINPGQTSLAGLLSTAANSKVYTYNNTMLDCYRGFNMNSSSSAMKNNIATGSGTNYYLVASVIHSNNISFDATSPDTSYRNLSVSFIDKTNSDFHLATSDTAARNAGVDLSQDYWLPITTDIDGHSRDEAMPRLYSGVDIGADESATPIYRSIAPSMSTYLDRGVDESGTDLTISGTTMTLENAAPDNVGVGDVIQYDSDGNSSIDAIAFISARASSTSFTVQSAKGGLAVPTSGADQDWQIFRAYTTLDNAEGGVENITNIDDDVDDFDISVSRADGKDIYASNEQWNIAAYANSTTADTVAVTISGWTTYPTNYIKIYTPVSASEVGTSQRHQGAWDDYKFKMEYSAPSQSHAVLNLTNAGYARADGLQISTDNNGYSGIGGIIHGTGDIMYISNNIIKSISQGLGDTEYGISGSNTAGGNYSYDIRIWNNIIYDFESSTSRGIYVYYNSGPTVYNNTIYNCQTGMGGNLGAFLAKNNIVSGSLTADYESADFRSGSTNNLSSDGTADDDPDMANSIIDAIVAFADATNHDFHLDSADTGARDGGVNLWNDSVLSVREDIDGEPRSEQGGWDIGADEGIFYQSNVAGHGTATMQMSLTDKMTDGLVGMWSFDGPDISGTTAYDRSPAGGNDGTITGAMPVIGKKGQALSFNGTTDFVNVGSGSNVDDLGPITVSAWVYPRSEGEGGYGSVIAKGGDVGTANGNWVLQNYPGYGDFRPIFNKGYATQLLRRRANAGCDLNEWCYLSMTWDGSASATNIHMYINGSETGYDFSQDGTGVKNTDAAVNLYIGNNSAQARTFDGQIDEVRVYSRILSSDEILRLYNLGSVEYVR